MGGPTESPFVVERGGRWYLFCGPSGFGEAWGRMQRGEDPDWPSAYSTTLVLESDDPFHFDRANVAGELAAHAAEVIVDEDGRDLGQPLRLGPGRRLPGSAPLDLRVRCARVSLDAARIPGIAGRRKVWDRDEWPNLRRC